MHTKTIFGRVLYAVLIGASILSLFSLKGCPKGEGGGRGGWFLPSGG